MLKAFHLVNSVVFLFLLTQAGLSYIKPVLYHCSIRFITKTSLPCCHSKDTLRQCQCHITSSSASPSSAITMTSLASWRYYSCIRPGSSTLLSLRSQEDEGYHSHNSPKAPIYSEPSSFRSSIRDKKKFVTPEQQYTVSKIS